MDNNDHVICGNCGKAKDYHIYTSHGHNARIYICRENTFTPLSLEDEHVCDGITECEVCGAEPGERDGYQADEYMAPDHPLRKFEEAVLDLSKKPSTPTQEYWDTKRVVLKLMGE